MTPFEQWWETHIRRAAPRPWVASMPLSVGVGTSSVALVVNGQVVWQGSAQ